MTDQTDNIMAVANREAAALMAGLDRAPRVPTLTHNPLVCNFVTSASPRALTADDLYSAVGKVDAVKMLIVPALLGAAVMEQAKQLADSCSDNAIAETVKHTRVIRQAVKEHDQRLAKAYGSKTYTAYRELASAYLAHTATELWLMEMQAESLCANQLPDEQRRSVASHVLVILMLEAFIRKHDRECNRVMRESLRRPVPVSRDVYHDSIRAMCIAIGEDLGFRLDPDDNMAGWVKVMANKAWRIVDEAVKS